MTECEYVGKSGENRETIFAKANSAYQNVEHFYLLLELFCGEEKIKVFDIMRVEILC